MSDHACNYAGDRAAALIAFLYDDLTAAERAAFDEHARACALCTAELAALSGVRSQLGVWTPPEPQWSHAVSQVASRLDRAPWYRAVPAWMQAVAAVLVLGTAAGAANLDIRHDENGLSIRTGWLRREAVASPRGTSEARSVGSAPVAVVPSSAADVVTRAEFDAAIQQLHDGLVQPKDTDRTLMQARALLSESERKQENELALRTAALFRDVQAQREADLAKIDRSFSVMNRELLGQREVNSSMMSLVRLGQR